MAAFTVTGFCQEKIIRVDTDLISVPVSVLDRNGRYLTDIPREKFRIFEDGEEQEIVYFAAVDSPVTVFLLIDVSDSVRVELADITRAANSFVQKLRPTDYLMAATFSWRTEMLLSKTKIGDLRKRFNLRISERDPDTLIYDAVDFAQKKMKKVNRRSAIIILSDAFGSGLAASAKGNLRVAAEQNSVFYSLHFGVFRERPFADPKRLVRSRSNSISYLTELAQKTGGRYFRFDLIEDLDQTFEEIAKELRQQYSLGYYASHYENTNRRKITVKVDMPGVSVRARNEVIYKKR